MTISTSIAAISRLLMDVSLEATVLLTVAWIAAHLLSRASAAFRHRLWSLTMISLMALPVLPLILPSWDWEILPARSKIDTVEAGESGSSASALLEESNANSESPGAAESVRENPDADSHSKAGKPVGATAQAISAPADMTAAPSLPADPFQSPTSQIPTSSFGQSLDWLRLCLVGGWLIGAIACLIGQLFGLRQVRHLSHSSRVVVDEVWRSMFDELCRQLRIGRFVELRESPQLIVPLTWGVFRARVMVPAIARNWSVEMRRAVLLHELAHVKRADVPFQFIARLACALYWFHPLAWIALRYLRQEREQACDDVVICAGESPSDYAERLVEVARLCTPHGPLALAVGMARRSSLESRLQGCSTPRAAIGR